MRRFVIIAAAVTVLHLILCILSIVNAFTFSLGDIDAIPPEKTTAEIFWSNAADILIFPIGTGMMHIRHMTAALSWAGLVLNSSLWGVAFAGLFAWSRRARPSAPQGV